MSADIAVFHSSEVDDPAILAEGWYIGAFRGDTLYADETCVGPYPSNEAAALGMSAGDWLYGMGKGEKMRAKRRALYARNLA